MSTSELLHQEIERTREPLLIEAHHFPKCLEQQAAEECFIGLVLSETVLAKDWNILEDDAAWATL